MRAGLVAAVLAVLMMATVGQADAGDQKSWAEAVAGLEAKPGLLTVYLDHDQGRILLELPAAGPEDGHIARFIHADYLRAGLGSNPVGLDRNSGAGSHVVSFRRLGKHVVLEAENYRYRASSARADERRAVRDSFATSVLWTGEIIARNETNGHLLIDIGDFLTADAYGVAARLKAAGQGAYKLDAGRSLVDSRATLVFPENLEFEALLTFGGDQPGPEVRATTPDPRSVTLVAHHSFMRLPDERYVARRSDPRAGIIDSLHNDYAAPIDAPIEVRLARRFRLEKINPGAAPSRVRKPIVFYIDRGAPEPVRSALVEGAGWWAEAFIAAGFIDAYRVEVLPEGVNPLDARYNVVHWVHRATRGWSYGGAVADPRTGETLRGFVLLGSLRIRQDRMIFEGLAGAQNSGHGGADDPVQIALARIRQLAAHEVGHSLGLLHNMAASTYGAGTYGGSASVMDYPAPEIAIGDDGSLDFSHAYGVGVGVWDKFAIKYLYGQFDPGADEARELDKLVAGALADGLIYVGDPDARPADAANPLGNLWDTGPEPVASLRHTLKVRDIALKNFGLGNIAAGQRVSDLQKVIVPIYLYHRYQLAAAVKVVGGMTFGYGVKGDGQPPAATLDPAYQRDALAGVLETLDPARLDLPERVLAVLTPVHQGFGDAKFPREGFRADAFPAFDVLAAADVAGGLAIGALLNPARAARLIEFHRRDATNPSFEYVLGRLTGRLFRDSRSAPARQVEIRRRLQSREVSELIGLALSPAASPGVIERVDGHLAALARRLGRSRGGSDVARAHARRLVALIVRHLERPAEPRSPIEAAPKVPPGSPIGAHYCWHCEGF